MTRLLVAFHGTHVELCPPRVCLKYGIEILYLMFYAVATIYNQQGIGVGG